MIRVQAPSRLHFGLLSLPDAHPTLWRDVDGRPALPARQFGGVGLMLEKPGIDLVVDPASEWSTAGPGAERALAFARRFCDSTGVDAAFRIEIAHCPPEHVGLGTGTQLGLAVASAVARAIDDTELTPPRLAEIIGRGQRSALGIHGFAKGGFVVDGGKTLLTRIAPLVSHFAFPEDWAVLLVTPAGVRGTHGHMEQSAFAQLSKQETSLRQTEALCRVVLLGLLPALAEHDIDGFGDALYEFNRRVGELFRPWQGAIYAHPQIAECVLQFRRLRVTGVGQSSWGPTTFAIVPRDRAALIGEVVRRQLGLQPHELILTQASRGANVTPE